MSIRKHYFVLIVLSFNCVLLFILFPLHNYKGIYMDIRNLRKKIISSYGRLWGIFSRICTEGRSADRERRRVVPITYYKFCDSVVTAASFIIRLGSHALVAMTKPLANVAVNGDITGKLRLPLAWDHLHASASVRSV